MTQGPTLLGVFVPGGLRDETASGSRISMNSTLAAGASTGIGFNGTFNSSNPVPTSFTLNGTTCTQG